MVFDCVWGDKLKQSGCPGVWVTKFNWSIGGYHLFYRRSKVIMSRGPKQFIISCTGGN